MFLVRLQGEFEIDHSWAVKGLYSGALKLFVLPLVPYSLPHGWMNPTEFCKWLFSFFYLVQVTARNNSGKVQSSRL